MDKRAFLAIILLALTISGSGCYMQASTSGDRAASPHGNSTVTPAPLPADSQDYYYRSYNWTYNGTEWQAALTIPKVYYQFYKSRPHDRVEDYAQYALSDYDRLYLKQLIADFKKAGVSKNYSDNDNVMNVIAFVQSLPYTSDLATTGYDEYPRYPIETLVDDGGDCEDTAILAAAILNEMGYGTVLLRLPGHMAVGVKCSDGFPGTYYEFRGSKYYYVDTTCKNWPIGVLPDEYKNSSVTVFPMIQSPVIDVNFSAVAVCADAEYVYYRFHGNVTSVGTGAAKNISVYVAALALSQGENKVWAPDSYIRLGDFEEGVSGWAEATLAIPRKEKTQIECIVYGDNFEPIKRVSDAFYTS